MKRLILSAAMLMFSVAVMAQQATEAQLAQINSITNRYATALMFDEDTTAYFFNVQYKYFTTPRTEEMTEEMLAAERDKAISSYFMASELADIKAYEKRYAETEAAQKR